MAEICKIRCGREGECYDLKDAIARGKIDELETKLDNLDNTYATDSDINSLQEQINNLGEVDTSGLASKEELDAVSTDVSNLSGEVESLSGAVESLSDAVETVTEKVVSVATVSASEISNFLFTNPHVIKIMPKSQIKFTTTTAIYDFRLNNDHTLFCASTSTVDPSFDYRSILKPVYRDAMALGGPVFVFTTIHYGLVYSIPQNCMLYFDNTGITCVSSRPPYKDTVSNMVHVEQAVQYPQIKYTDLPDLQFEVHYYGN